MGRDYPETRKSPTKELSTTLDKTNPKHQRIAMLLGYGMTCTQISDHINISEGEVKRITALPGTRQRTQNLMKLGATMAKVRHAEFDQLLNKSITTLHDVLDSEDPKVSADQKMRAALAVMDRHPDGEFIKASKQTYEDTTGIVSEAIASLKTIAMRTNADVIDITSDPTERGPQRSSVPSESEEVPPSVSSDSALEAINV